MGMFAPRGLTWMRVAIPIIWESNLIWCMMGNFLISIEVISEDIPGGKVIGSSFKQWEART